MKLRNIYRLLFLLAIFVVVALLERFGIIPDPKKATTTSDLATVTRVVDGDTIQISTGAKVRYIGVDTPETVDPRRAVGCFGKEASAKNKELVEGKQIRMEKDVSETDKFGRLLRYVYVKAGDREIFVNDYLVREGYAVVSTFPPDVAHVNQFLESQHYAQANNKGLWSSC